jgi:hypothetical protein
MVQVMLAALMVVTPAADAPAQDVIEVVRVDGSETVVYRDAASEQAVELRATEAPVADARIEAAGAGDVVWASWSENGEPWIAVSTDGGGSWASARPGGGDVELRFGRVGAAAGRPEPSRGLAAKATSRLYIVQLHTPSLAALRARLVEAGAELLGYLPHDAHLVRIAPEAVQRLRGLPFVRWVGPYHPAYRLEPTLLAELEQGGGAPRRYVLQTVAPGVPEKERLADDVAATGGTVVLQTPNGYLIEAELTPAQAMAVLHSDSLQWLQPWQPDGDDMDNVRVVSGANQVESVGGYDGTGVVAEVMDSGTMLTHPDFDGILVHGPTPSLGDHGTCTYGIVFGNGDRDGDGDPRALGMLPGAQGYFADYSDLVDRYQHTAELVDPIGAVFQTNSWGTGRNLHYSAISAEMDDIIWLYDIPIFQSQSNSGDQYSRQQAWAKNIISVGGVYHYDDLDPGNDCWCSGASIGPANDGRVKPDLTFFYDDTWTTDREPGGYASGLYADFGGTSGATPMTAGTGGLILQMWADNIYGNNPPGTTVFERRPHAATLKAIMVNTAEQYPFTGTAHDHARVRQGWGVPSAARVLDRAPQTVVIDESSVLTELAFDAYTADVPVGQEELKITLVYADRAANPAAAIHRVNDVTLRVLAPDGTEYWGNHGLGDGPWSVPGGAPDTVNTVENVFVEAPMAGQWRVEVHAVEVNMDVHAETPEDDQDYALVVSGVDALEECRTAVPPPTDLEATATADNQVTLSWNGTTSAYEVWRSEGGCGRPAELVGTAATAGFVDTAVPGGISHGYLVRALDGCPSVDSECVEITATGPCELAPDFAGIERATGTSGDVCAVEVGWSEATARCLGPVVYNVYRSTDPAFVPGTDTLIAACRSVTSLVDSGMASGQDVTYVVRAEDLGAAGEGPCGGREDGNLERRTLSPTQLLGTGFETGLEGWVAVIPPLSITGEFVVDDPIGTTSGGGQAQPEDAAVGSRCLYTGRNPAGAAGQADVDFGEVVAVSPVLDASGFSSLDLQLSRWFYIRDNGEDAADYYALDVSSNGGGSWVNLETLDQFATGHNQWTVVGFALEDYVALTDRVRLRVRVSDGEGPGNIIEGAIDEVTVQSSDACGSSALFSDRFESGDAGAWARVGP